MTDPFLLYISAAADLRAERELLGKSIAEIPVDLGWKITLSPRKNEPLDLKFISRADCHILIMGSDIRAPIGLELRHTLRFGNKPITCLKRGISRTPAANEFTRYVREFSQWQMFSGWRELQQLVLPMIVDRVLERTLLFNLTSVEISSLEQWRKDLVGAKNAAEEDLGGGTGESSVILSVDRFTPSDGILINPAGEENDP
jgi:hypothetical protein